MHVFVSHTVRDPRDLALARQIAEGLGARGVSVFITPDSVRPGAVWEREIVAALLSRCSHMVVIVTAASMRPDGYVMKEIALAKERRASGGELEILQIRAGDVATPFPELQEIAYHDDRSAQVEAVAAALGLPASTAVDRVFEPLSLLGSRRMTPGSLIATLCDRKKQERQFLSAFKAAVVSGHRAPQIYVVHGARREAHDSLVERLTTFVIGRYVAFAHGRAATVGRLRVDWPAGTAWRLAGTALLSELFARTSDEYVCDPATPLTAGEWLRRVTVRANAACVIEHELPAGGWAWGTPRVLAEYLDFWSAVAAARPAIDVVIFFKVLYDAEDSWIERKLLRRAIEKLPHAAQRAALPATLLDELQCIRQEDVVDWFDDRAAEYDLDRRERHCRALFASAACRRMSDVEARLLVVQREMRGNA